MRSALFLLNGVDVGEEHTLLGRANQGDRDAQFGLAIRMLTDGKQGEARV